MSDGDCAEGQGLRVDHAATDHVAAEERIRAVGGNVLADEHRAAMGAVLKQQRTKVKKVIM